jgi:polysaccharide export outer membrane protein
VKAGWPEATVTDAIDYVRSAEMAKSKPKANAKSDGPSGTSPAPEKPDAQAANRGTTDAAKPAADTNPPATAAPATMPPASAKAPETSTAPTETKTSDPAREEAGGNPSIPQTANAPDDYRIGAGDILKITVWHEPDASLPSAVVLPNGRISVPLLHEVEVAGLTVPQLEKLLTDRFSSMINTPAVSVVVTGMNSKKIYITGKVKKEGPLSYTYQMTVMQALSEAGGVTEYAKKKGIYVLRNEDGRQFKIPFDYAAVLKGERLETNVPLIPGDMIVVP